jgi:hypothetical protein
MKIISVTNYKKAKAYPYLNLQNPLVLPIIAYTLSSTKLDIRAKYFLPGSEGVG